MILTAVRWLFHWFGQGLKLLFFSGMAAIICAIPLSLPVGFLENGAYHYDELSITGKVGVIGGYLLCFAIGLAGFTALLASQLRDDPLRAFAGRHPDRDDEENRGERKGAVAGTAKTTRE